MRLAHSSVHVTRRNFVRGVGLLSASAALSASTALTACARQDGSAEPPDAPAPLLAIIHTNDTHGHDVEVKSSDGSEGNFSMAAIPQLRADWEAKGYEVLVVDCGDATQGMPLVDQSAGEAAITFMNACGYDAMALGNHEFDRGPSELAAYEGLAEFPLLSANVLDAKSGERRFSANTVVELTDGTKVGLFGLTTPATLTTAKPEFARAFGFLAGEDLYACAQQQVDELRAAGCDLVVCLGHLGNEQTCSPSTSTELLHNVEGIDLFLDGHDHELVEEEVAGTLLVETGCYLRNVGLVVIDEGMPANEGVAYGTYDGTDASAQAVIEAAYEQVQSELGVTLGHTGFLLDGARDPGLRTQETNLGDLCADALRWSAEQSSGEKVDAAVVNGGSVRASIEAGDITLAHIKSVYAFSNQVVVLNVLGAQLLEALEAGYQSAGEDAIGAFPQVAGIEVTVDTTVPYERGEQYPDSTYFGPASPGARVTVHTVGGRPFSANETYAIAMSDFLAQGGDTYHAFREAAEDRSPVVCDFDYEALSSYIVVACDHEVPADYERPQGRIQIGVA